MSDEPKREQSDPGDEQLTPVAKRGGHQPSAAGPPPTEPPPKPGSPPAPDAALAVNAADLAGLLAAVHDALPLLKQGPKEREQRERLEAAAARFQL